MKTFTTNTVYLSLIGLSCLVSLNSCTTEPLTTLETVATSELAVSNDPDKDGLTTEIEIILGTDPNNADTDNDGLLDGIEDANQNGIIDETETNPLLEDTDSDGILDGTEDLNRNGIVDAAESSPLMADTDGDGILDGVEDANQNGILDVGETSSKSNDSDNDGIEDGIEDMNHNGVFDVRETDPNNPDTDGDGILDGTEDLNHNGKLDAGEMYPLSKDSDGDLLEDGIEDKNHNGIQDAGESSPLMADTDGDGIKDGDEDLNHNGIQDAGESDPNKKDTDGDGINDADDDDADGNGIKDIEEHGNNDDNAIEGDEKYEAKIKSTDGYEVKISIKPKSVNAASKKCQYGYNYTISLKYDIKIDGKDKPKKLYTLQGTLNKDSSKLFFDLPNKKSKGEVKSSNDWTELTNCENPKVDDMNFSEIVIEIEGPGIAHQFVTLSKKD